MARILLCDDDADLRNAFCVFLEKAGHDVSQASNGETALGFIYSNQVDLVVLDIFMPDKDGIETLMEMRKERSGVKIIAISGGSRMASGDFLIVAKKLGADRVLYKPIKGKELIQVVDELLAE